MQDIHQDFFNKYTSPEIFDAIASRSGLDKWRTKKSSGKPVTGEQYTPRFRPEYDWFGIETISIPEKDFMFKTAHGC